MYLYFDKTGNLKEQINDEALRQGNSNINKLYVFWEKAVDNVNITALWARFKSDESTYYPSSTTWMVSTTTTTETIPYDKNRDLKFFNYFTEYKFYVVTLPDEVLGVSGSWLGTLQFVETNAITTLGQLAFYVSESNSSVEADENINIAQWNYLIKMVSDLSEEYDGFITDEELQEELANYVTKENVNEDIDGSKTFLKYTHFSDGLYSARDIVINKNKGVDIANGYKNGSIPTRAKLRAEENNNNSNDVTLYLPNKDGTLATTDDINTALGTVYKIQGSSDVNSLNASLSLVSDKQTWNGYVYNITDSGNLNNYSGATSVIAGDNVVFVYTNATNWGWDKLAGTIDLSSYALKSELPTKTSDLTNNSGFVTQTNVNNTSGNNYTIAYNLVVNSNGYQFNSYKFADVTLQTYPNYEIKQFQVSTTSAVVTDLSIIKSYLQMMTGHDRIPTYDEDRPINEFIVCTSNDTMWKLQYDTTNGLLAFKVSSTPAVFSAKEVAYLTTAPSSNNTSGKLKFVVLSSEPATYYDGYYYIITGSNS